MNFEFMVNNSQLIILKLKIAACCNNSKLKIHNSQFKKVI